MNLKKIRREKFFSLLSAIASGLRLEPEGAETEHLPLGDQIFRDESFLVEIIQYQVKAYTALNKTSLSINDFIAYSGCKFSSSKLNSSPFAHSHYSFVSSPEMWDYGILRYLVRSLIPSLGTF